MSATIEIDEKLFCEMISSLLDKVDTSQQVAWLKKYGANFYDLKLYRYVEIQHAITEEFFQDITTKFWDNEVQYKTQTWADLKAIITTSFYESYLGLGFNSKPTADDITFTMEDYGSDKAKRYYSPTLLKCIAANHDLNDEALFSFTKAVMPNNNLSVVFKIVIAEKAYFYNLTDNPI